MNKKEEFKNFVKNNPILIKYVNNNEKSWQDFFELYDLYGDNNEIWDSYLNYDKNDIKSSKSEKKYSISEFVDFIKKVDLDSIENSTKSIQRVVEMIGDLTLKDSTKDEYKPRPLYKHFDE